MRDVRAEMQGGNWRVELLNFDIDTFVPYYIILIYTIQCSEMASNMWLFDKVLL